MELYFYLSFVAAVASFCNVAMAMTIRQAATYNNPVLWYDLADLEVIRVDDAYYYSASTMHYSPGAPVLKSYDLTTWELIGHSVPELPGDEFFLNGSDTGAYVQGIYASTLGYRKSNNLFYWYGCMRGKTHIYTASNPEGPWTHHTPIDKCYYDLGLLVDDDDTMYIAYGAVDIHVAELSTDGLSEVRNEVCLLTSINIHPHSNAYRWCIRKKLDDTLKVPDSTKSTATTASG